MLPARCQRLRPVPAAATKANKSDVPRPSSLASSNRVGQRMGLCKQFALEAQPSAVSCAHWHVCP